MLLVIDLIAENARFGEISVAIMVFFTLWQLRNPSIIPTFGDFRSFFRKRQLLG